MASHIWSVLCDRSLIDKDTNVISLIGVAEALNFTDSEEALLERIKAEDAAGIQVSMELVTMWARSDFAVPEESEARVTIVGPLGAGHRIAPCPVKLRESTHYRVRLQITGIPFVGFGAYYFVVETRRGKQWIEGARVPLLCKRIVPSEKPGPQMLAAVPIDAPADKEKPQARRGKK